MDGRKLEGWIAYLAVLGLARSVLGWLYPGFLTGDDVEILQEGMRRVTDLEYLPWSIRNTIISDLLVAPAVWLAQLLGIQDRWNLCWFASLPFTAASIANIELLRRIVSRVTSCDLTGFVAAGVYSLHWIPFGYAGTVYPRTASTSVVLLATWLIVRRASGPSCFAAGLLAALGFAFRYSECIYLLPLIVLLAHRAWGEVGGADALRLAAQLLAGFGIGVLVFVGIYDWLTLGAPFSSLAAFAKFTLVEKQASSLVREQPVYWYLWRTPRWLDPLALVLLGFGVRRSEPRALLPFVVLPLAILSVIHHKELRYLQGVLPFTSALVASGVSEVLRRYGKAVAALLLVPSLVYSLAQVRFVEKKSTAAVAAARAISGTSGVDEIAAPQLWAFGDRIFFETAPVLRQVSHPLRLAALEGEIEGADRVALYAESIEDEPRAIEVLARLGYCESRRFESDRSESVVLYAPCTPKSDDRQKGARKTGRSPGRRSRTSRSTERLQSR